MSMTNITLPGVLSNFSSMLVPTPIEMSVSSPSPGKTPVVIPNSDLIMGFGLTVSNTENPPGEPNGIPVVIPDPKNRYVGGKIDVTNGDLVDSGLPSFVVGHNLVLGGLPVVNNNSGDVPGGIPSGLSSSTELTGKPAVKPPELVGTPEQFLGAYDAVINGVSRRVISPGDVPVVI
jgi:hypothetical protein